MKLITPIYAIALLFILNGCGDQKPSSTSAEQAAPEIAAQINPQKLIGNWMRSDGNYTIKIDKVKDQGYLSAAYFNPSPIHTDKTTYKVENNQLKVHMLLNDTDYPKCTYDLIYNDEKQILLGQYYQAKSGQTYNVIFQKVNK
jgi:uncharacterized protein (DUF2147 family)